MEIVKSGKAMGQVGQDLCGGYIPSAMENPDEKKEIHPLGIQSYSQLMSKGCPITETKRIVFRFHETILSFGDWIPSDLY